MSEQTSIEWCNHSWSPWEGCTKVSPGCAHCYAEARNRRFKGGNWGKGAPRRRTVDWQKPCRWNAAFWENNGPERRLPRPRVFPSLCDWLDDEVPIKWLVDFLRLIHGTPYLDWLLLTKRPENFASRIEEAFEFSPGEGWLSLWLQVDAPANVWLGVSVEDQTRADERIPKLMHIPARVRFISVEPMLEPIDLRISAFNGSDSFGSLEDIHWVIVGGESGRGARPCNVDWIRDVVRQNAAAGVPCFVKQLGGNPQSAIRNPQLKHPKGGDPAEWPEDLRVRQFPEVKP